MSNSQFGQEDFVLNFFNHKKNGIFFEAGGMDGVRHSNTLLLEKEYGWQGLLVEPSPKLYNDLVKNRNCYHENVLLGSNNKELTYLHIIEPDDVEKHRGSAGLAGVVDFYDPRHLDRIHMRLNETNASSVEIKMKTISLQSLFDKYNITDIDYFSLDTEGSELDILKSVDFEKVNIKLLGVEFNYETDNETFNFIKSKGFNPIHRLGPDIMFTKSSPPRTF